MAQVNMGRRGVQHIRNMHWTLGVFILFIHSTFGSPMLADSINEGRILTKIAFGSCNNQRKAQPLWPIIEEYKADIFVWLGDVVYNDQQIIAFVFRASTLAEMHDNYSLQKRHVGYQQLLSTNLTVLGTWVIILICFNGIKHLN